MEVLRTPDERFTRLPGFPYEPRYHDVTCDDGTTLRMHFVDEGAGPVVLLMHGEPTWSFLYRTMIPPLVTAGLRVLAPDLIGFGRSDKPTDPSDYTYERHVDWVDQWLTGLDLSDITFFGQDWGGLIGLRLVARHPERFARVIVANTGLPTGDQQMSEAFLKWQRFAATTPVFPVSPMIQRSTLTDLPADVLAGYDAPFPDESYKAGARVFPSLVPTRPDDPSSQPNRDAWGLLVEWNKPLLTAFSDSDPITAGTERVFHGLVPGAAGQPHVTIESAGHFLQEDKGPELADVIIRFMAG